MHFDDRLATVLRSRAASEALARIQFRQLIDLLGTAPAEASGEAVDAAYGRITELSAQIPAPARARILGEPGMRLRNARLVAALASGSPDVARAAIDRAQLDENEWLDLAPALPLHARAMMRQRRDLGPAVEARMARLGIHDRALPPARPAKQAGSASAEAPEPGPASEPAPAPPAESAESGIRAIVQRIESFRKARAGAEGQPAPADSPRLPLGDAARVPALPASFDFTADGDHRITWASPAMAAPATGLSILPGETGALAADPGLAEAIRRRQPLRGAIVTITGAPAIAGRWRLDAAPRFLEPGGRFIGWHGRFRRPSSPAPAAAPRSAEAIEGERIRQLLHELRTPVNAIQGFAEVIQQQLFGPTPHDYRALAANIASDAARILSGFEDLERLARLDTGAMQMEPGTCDLAALASATVARLTPFMAARNSELALRLRDEALPVRMAGPDAERLLWRLLATVAGLAAPGEHIPLRGRITHGRVRLKIGLPASLARLDDDALFRAAASPGAQALSAGLFGSGFALRLARAEARSAGGLLERRGDALRLELPAHPETPGLTGTDAPHSQDETRQAQPPG